MREKVALIGAEREGEPSSQVEGCCREWMKAGQADVPSLVSSLGQACRDVVTCDDRVGDLTRRAEFDASGV